MSIQCQYVTVPSGSIKLEAMCGFSGKTGKMPGVVICHPHPLMGGSMDNNVVHALFGEFARRGFVALAFNFRGTGKSEGCYEGGEAEVADVEAALDWLGGQDQVRGDSLGVLGYSFGAWVGLNAAMRRQPQVRCAGAVAPPVALFSFDFLSSFEGFFFFVSGDRDAYCPAERKSPLLSGPAGKREGRVVSGTDHFFWDRESEAAGYLCDRFKSVLETS